MSKFRAFLASFFFSFTLMCRGLGAVWAARGLAGQAVTGQAEKIPVAKPGVEDSKTLLFGAGERPFFFLIKLNAIENRVAIVGISPRWENLGEIFRTGGGERAAEAVSRRTGVKVDYFLSGDAGQILRDFGEIDISSPPSPAADYLLKNARRADGDSLVNRRRQAGGFLDNGVGIEFLTRCRENFLTENRQDFGEKFSARVRENYSDFDTNLNTESLERIERIAGFLAKYPPQISTDTLLAGDKGSKIAPLFGCETLQGE